MALITCFGRKRPSRVVAAGLVLVVIIGGLAHGHHVRHHLLFLCAFVWCRANRPSQPWSTDLGYIWAATTRLLYFAFVAIGGRALKLQQTASHGHACIEALERERELLERIT